MGSREEKITVTSPGNDAPIRSSARARTRLRNKYATTVIPASRKLSTNNDSVPKCI